MTNTQDYKHDLSLEMMTNHGKPSLHVAWHSCSHGDRHSCSCLQSWHSQSALGRCLSHWSRTHQYLWADSL